MKTTAEYLDALKDHFGARSDYALKDFTGWHPNQIGRYRHLDKSFDDVTAAKVATWLDVPLEKILIDMNAQRAKDANVRKAWMKVAGAVATALIAVQVAQLAPPGFWSLDQAAALFFAFTYDTDYTHVAAFIAVAALATLALYRARRRQS